MREGGFRAEVGNLHLGFQRQRGRHDLAVDRVSGLFGQRPGVQLLDLIEHFTFAGRHIDFRAVFLFCFTDLQHHIDAFIQQTHDFGIERIDFVSQIIEIHWSPL